MVENFNSTITNNNEFSSKLMEAKKLAQKDLRLHEISEFCTTIGYVSEINKISMLKADSDAASISALGRLHFSDICFIIGFYPHGRCRS